MSINPRRNLAHRQHPQFLFMEGQEEVSLSLGTILHHHPTQKCFKATVEFNYKTEQYSYYSRCKSKQIFEDGLRLGDGWSPHIGGDIFMPTSDTHFDYKSSVGYEKAIVLLKSLKNTYRSDGSFRIKVLLVAPEGHSSVYVLGGG